MGHLSASRDLLCLAGPVAPPQHKKPTSRSTARGRCWKDETTNGHLKSPQFTYHDSYYTLGPVPACEARALRNVQLTGAWDHFLGPQEWRGCKDNCHQKATQCMTVVRYIAISRYRYIAILLYR